MKIKRFLAPDIRQALQQVKETLGADAVILSNRKTEQGVEIIATCDFDLETVTSAKPEPRPPETAAEPAMRLNPIPESSAKSPPKPAFSARGYSAVAEFTGAMGKSQGDSKRPKPAVAATKSRHSAESVARVPQSDTFASLRCELQEMRRLLDRHLSRESWRELMRESPTRIDLLRTLNELGFARPLALELARQAGVHADFDSALRQVRQILTERVAICDPDLDCGGIVALVGPTGVGKTTTIAKLAARFRLEHGPRQIALMTTDNYRIAAYEQLSTYARILGVPIRVASNSEELCAILRGFRDKKLILIDTAGMSPRDLRLAEQLALLSEGEMAISTYLVLSAGAQLGSLNEAIKAFAACRPKAVILTKLDEAGCLGPALSALIGCRLPIAFFTDGQQVPEDLHPARSDRLIQRCFESAPISPSADAGFDFEDWLADASA
ncbi:MAG: flagellar biosynthesis protein FlhF [Methylohalobius sp.]